MSEVNNTQARRNENAENARMLAECGVTVFPSSGKVPLVKAFNRLDTDLTENEREEHAAKYREENDGEEPFHIGATKTLSVVKMLWRKFPDAVPSIACGPSGLVVLDADAKDGGPDKLARLFDENGGFPEGAPKVPTRDGGFHLYLKSDGTFGNRAGALKRDCGTDVRGRGGQTVAPGSWREDGKRYGTRADLFAFLRAFRRGLIPEVPGFIREKIGESPEGETLLSDTDPIVKSLIEQLGANDWPDFSVTFDPVLGKYDLESLRTREPEFANLYDEPTDDRSTNRFNAARYLAGAFPHFTVQDYASFVSEWDGAGEFDARALAREFAKAKAAPMYVPTDGSAFADVSYQVEDDTPTQEPEPSAKKSSLAFEMEADVATNAVLPDWLIEGIIEASTLCVPYGAPNAGKSLVVLDMLYHVAAGKPWRDRDVKQGCVLYISVEGPNGTARRAKAWREYHGIADGERLPLAFIRTSVDLFSDKKSARSIVEAVKRLEALTGLPCRAIAIDTVSAVTPGMVENAPEDWSVFLRNLRTIMAATKGAVLPVHHTGKDEGRGLRGHTSFLAAVDSTLLVSDGRIKTMKMRDGKSGQAFPFEVKILNLWTDAKGKPVGAPVAIEPERGTALSAVNDDEDEAAMTARDEPADKLVATLSAVEQCIHEVAGATGDKPSEIGVSAGQVFARLNLDRKGAGLAVLKERTMVTRLLAKLIKTGEIVKMGDNRRTEYRTAS